MFVVLLGGGGYVGYKMFFTTSKKVNPLYAVPSDAAYIVEIEDPFDAWTTFSSSNIWGYVKTNPYFADIANYVDSLNDVVNNNKQLSKLLASRPMLLSGHQIKNDLEYFFVIDLGGASELLGFRNALVPVFEDLYRVNARDYHGTEILELYDEEYRETLYLAIMDNLLIGAYRHTLVEASIDQIAEPVIGRDLDFVTVQEELGQGGMFRVYLQMPLLLTYLKDNFTTEETLKELSSVFRFTGFDFDMDNEAITLTGFTSMDESVSSVYNLFHTTGATELTVPEMITQRTALYTGIGFEEQKDFTDYLIASIKEDPESGDEYTKNIKKLEKFLKIDIEENFFSWMDNEVGMVQIHPYENDGEVEYAVILKSSDGDLAKENLDYIGERIKKKTPVKFKKIEYKDHEINFMSVKGFFKLILGKLFSKIEKPYYTIIDDFVVFSNSPRTLRGIIDDFSEGRTLIGEPEFEKQMEAFTDESGVFMYINIDHLVQDSKTFVDKETYEGVVKHADYIRCFPMAGMQLVPEDGMYQNQIVISFKDLKDAADWNKQLVDLYTMEEDDVMDYDSVFKSSDLLSDEEEFIVTEDINPDDLDANTYTEEYENGNIKLEVGLKDGFKDGTYREYSEEGNIIIKGKFKNDLRDGLWREYDEDGNVIKRTRYKDGQPDN